MAFTNGGAEKEGELSESSAKRIRVVLFPTSTYHAYSRGCNLLKLCKLLNNTQQEFVFCIESRISSPVDHTYRQSGIRLRHKVGLQNRKTLPKRAADVTQATLNAYFVDVDVFEQIKDCYWHLNGRSLSDNEFAIAIGSEVVVPDIEANEFEGDAAADSYSCLGNLLGEDDFDNNTPKKYNTIAFISLIRCNLLFPEPNVSRKEARGIVARYIILNICAELAERVFGRTLGHEHMARCVMEDSWSGLDAERASYSEVSICQECQELAENYGTAKRYRDKSVEQLINAINKMCQCAETIFQDSKRSYKI